MNNATEHIACTCDLFIDQTYQPYIMHNIPSRCICHIYMLEYSLFEYNARVTYFRQTLNLFDWLRANKLVFLMFHMSVFEKKCSILWILNNSKISRIQLE